MTTSSQPKSDVAEPSTPLEVALWYAARGIATFPCHEVAREELDCKTNAPVTRQEKAPRTSNGFKAGTTTPRIVSVFFGEKYPTALVGIPTGVPLGAWVLDLDRHGDEDEDGHIWLSRMEAEFGPLPKTARAATANNGTHLFFSDEPGLSNRTSIANGADCRATGAYIIGPGSVMADGRAYYWVNDDGEPYWPDTMPEFAKAPEWLLDLVRARQKPEESESVAGTYTYVPGDHDAYVEAAMRSEIETLAAQRSDRNPSLNIAATNVGTLVGAGAVSRADAESQLMAAARANGYVDKRGERAARATMKSGLDFGVKNPRKLPERAANDNHPVIDITGILAKKKKPVTDPATPSDNTPPSDNKRIRATPFVLRDPSQIPTREWLYGGHYIRNYLSVTLGAGGGGKSSNVVTESLAMVTGLPLLGGQPTKPICVWYVNAEDPADEIERRFGGAIKHFGITAEQIGGRLFTDSGRDQEFVVMKMDGRGTKVCEPVVRQITDEINQREIDVLIVDPFVSTHEVEENDNSKIQQVAATWTKIAGDAKCAIEVIHHVSKNNLEITADSGRGAGALKDKARSVRVINPMADSQASSAGIPAEEARGYFRIEMGKANLVKGGGKPTWRRFASVSLGNGPKTLGMALAADNIGVVEPWQWPSIASAIEDVPADLLEGLKARMGAGSYREHEQSKDWAGKLVAELFGMNASDAKDKATIKRMLAAWTAQGHFTFEERPDAKRMLKKYIVPVFAAP